MKIAVFFVHSLIAVACATIFAMRVSAADSPREHLSLDLNWKFHLGDDWPGAARWDQVNVNTWPISGRGSDADWPTVNLPHDWAISLPNEQDGRESDGFRPLGPNFPKTSVGWYRRTFDLPSGDSGKRIWLTFDGVMHDATVWVNGWFVKQNVGGYYPFRADITDIVHFGGRNTIVVRVDATKFQGWFYEGAGIYRHVWLDETAPLALAPDGVFVYSMFKNNVPSDRADIHVEADLLNTLTNAAAAVVNCEIISPEGQSVARFKESENLAAESPDVVKLESKLSSPVLWSPESPELYKLVTTVSVGGTVVDEKETAFGIRTVGFDPTNGFLLNGKHYELLGACIHQGWAGVGVAVPDSLQYFRVRRLKEMGCNAIRTAHNPPAPGFLDACDQLGMLVMDENRLFGSDPAELQMWHDHILRDRNHPSVAIWSLGNEERGVQDTPQGANVARTMQDYGKQLDPTRPMTYAAPNGNTSRGINSVIEVRGWNYFIDPGSDQYHADHPAQPEVCTEQGSIVSTRGVYANDRSHGYISSYDTNWPGWTPPNAQTLWGFVAARPWLSGVFIWSGFDYAGEPSPYWWPDVTSQFGIIDRCGFPKDGFYYYQSWWSTNVVLHLLPHWNWSGRDGQEIRVVAYSNCKQAELFLNGVSLGRQVMQANMDLAWAVKYEPGMLSAKGYDGAGNVIAETKVETTGDAAQIQLTPDRRTINADGEDVAVFTVSGLDAQGRVVPIAQNKINFSIEGAGKIIGVGNGDPACHEPDSFAAGAAPQWSRSLFNGLAEVIVQSTRDAGQFTLTAGADGLETATTTVQTLPCAPRPSLP
ncbi:MAG: beta-galactosidase GalA [Limisphaerales bacterium]